MKKTAILLTLVLLLGAACTANVREALQTLAQPTPGGLQVAELMTATPGGPATATPPASAITLPTLEPTLSGPLGTLTAIAPLIATPVVNATPYVIENRGKPHFIEFHAWW